MHDTPKPNKVELGGGFRLSRTTKFSYSLYCPQVVMPIGRIEATALSYFIAGWNTRVAAPSDGWRDISSAPKDGSDIQLCMLKDNGEPGGRHYIVKTCHWEHRANAWRISGAGREHNFQNPTHWMPLPAAPGNDNSKRG